MSVIGDRKVEDPIHGLIEEVTKQQCQPGIPKRRRQHGTDTLTGKGTVKLGPVFTCARKCQQCLWQGDDIAWGHRNLTGDKCFVRVVLLITVHEPIRVIRGELHFVGRAIQPDWIGVIVAICVISRWLRPDECGRKRRKY